jgi:putative transposase
LRRQDSGVAARKHLWEVHHDPYDVTRIWVRNHWGQGWITVPWRHLGSVPVPFGELAWNHARRQLGGRDGTPDPDEQAVAAAVAALLEAASRGPAHQPGAPASSKDRKVAARTRATSPRTWPTPPAPEPAAALEAADQQQADTPAGKVVPLGVFDPYQEATKRW